MNGQISSTHLLLGESRSVVSLVLIHLVVKKVTWGWGLVGFSSVPWIF